MRLNFAPGSQDSRAGVEERRDGLLLTRAPEFLLESWGWQQPVEEARDRRAPASRGRLLLPQKWLFWGYQDPAL